MGKNITNIPTSEIQKNLGGLAVDNQYGPKTTKAVTDFQTANGLLADGIFGPKTMAVYQTKYGAGAQPQESSLITTSGASRTKESENSQTLDNALKLFSVNSQNQNPENTEADKAKKKIQKGQTDVINDTMSGSESDPYIKQLDSLAMRSNDSTKMLIQNIKAQKEQQKINIDKEFNNYKAGLQLLGIQSNAALATPDLLMGHIQEAENQHLDKLNQLDSEEAKALMDAENARADNDFKVLNEKMSYVKEIKAQKAQALKDYYDTIAENSPNSATYQETQKTASLAAHDILDTLQSLNNDDKGEFLIAVAKKFNLPIGTLVTALNDENQKVSDQMDKDEKANEDKLLSPSEAAVLGVPYGTTEAQAAKMGITPERYKPDSGDGEKSQAQKLKDATVEIQNALKTGKDANGNVLGNPKGAKDGFVDPGVYIKAFESWPGTDKEFLAKFPVVGTVNPESYKILPTSIQPKVKEDASTKLLDAIKKSQGK